MRLPVNEMFYTFQGEGVLMGLPAFFVRLHGCPIRCPWCDSAGTWHPKWVPPGIPKMEVEEIAEAAFESRAPFVVVTGGEPAVYDLKPLLKAFRDRSEAEVNLETSGAFPIQGDFNWITLSPKKWRLPLSDSVQRASEFKIIVEDPEDINFYLGVLREADNDLLGRSIWLHPEWGHRNDPVVLGAISSAVKQMGGLVRAGWQIHKAYAVDQKDPRSRPPVPLGGVPEKGT